MIRRTVSIALLGLLVLVLPAGCRRAAEESPPAPNVVIAVLDACRADKMSLYGFPRETTPHLDELAADPDAVVFRRHYVQAPWTKPSTASLFTGLYVSQHKVYRGHGQGEGKNLEGAYVTDRVQDFQDVMAERFKRAGYHTFAVIWGGQVLPEYGFAQGFDDFFTDEVRGRAGRVKKVLEMLDAKKGPAFGYVHFEGCHLPYHAPALEPSYMEAHAVPYDETARIAAGVDFSKGAMVFDVNRHGRKLEPEDVAYLNLIYEARMRYEDRRVVKRLVAGLRERGHWDDTLLIITADHGEELYEHGGYGHGHGLWDAILHVPLVVKFPKGRRPPALGKEVTGVTQAIDLLPSLTEYLGLPSGAPLSGTALFAGETPPHAIAERMPVWGPRGFAVVRDEWKLLHHGDTRHLAQIVADPAEKQNLVGEKQPIADEMSAIMTALHQDSFREDDEALVRIQLDKEAVEKLRRLGYIE
jgi:arylsulfatase A-like enzyme